MKIIDDDYCPINRPGIPCTNCGKMWYKHLNWACEWDENTDHDDCYRSMLPKHLQYHTPDMDDDEDRTPTIPVPAPTANADITDWRVWRDTGREASHCVCGVHRDVCSYHRR